MATLGFDDQNVLKPRYQQILAPLGATPPVPTASGAPVPMGAGQDQNTRLEETRTEQPGANRMNLLSPEHIQQSLKNLRFGEPPRQFAAPTLKETPLPTAGQASAASVAPPPLINAPRITAEQGGFTDFDALQRALYESQFRPVQRELQRQQGLADEQLKARLAQAGISDSGTGIAQEMRQWSEYDRQIAAASQDAATAAAVQRYGMEYTQSMENAKLRQEANLANAGFSLQAQIENARNILTSNVTSAQLATQASIANAQLATQASIAGAQIASQQAIAQAQLQLQTMGLNLQSEQNARQSFLQLLGLQEQDLARQDDFQLNNLSLLYNTYLKQMAIIAQIGTASFAKGDQSSSGINFNVGF
jgi:hypothetical protein